MRGASYLRSAKTRGRRHRGDADASPGEDEGRSRQARRAADAGQIGCNVGIGNLSHSPICPALGGRHFVDIRCSKYPKAALLWGARLLIQGVINHHIALCAKRTECLLIIIVSSSIHATLNNLIGGPSTPVG